MTKLERIGAYLGSHAKAWAGTAGSAATLAVTLFPSDHRVQEIGGAIGIFATYFLVHITPNAPASAKAAADGDLEKTLGELVHVPSDQLVTLVDKLGYMVETATAATVAATAVVASVSANAQPIAPEPESVSDGSGVSADQPGLFDAPATDSEPAPTGSVPEPEAPRMVAPETPPPSEVEDPAPISPESLAAPAEDDYSDVPPL